MSFDCAYCANTGFVVYLIRDGHDEMAPCCYCDTGKLIEFPPPDSKGNPRVGAWGEDGFWKGRDHSHLKPLNTFTKLVPPPAEFKEIFARLLAEEPEPAPRSRLETGERHFTEDTRSSVSNPEREAV